MTAPGGEDTVRTVGSGWARARERGAAALDYLGITVVGALVVTGLTLLAPGTASSVVAAGQQAVCAVTTKLPGGSCPDLLQSPADLADDVGATGDPYVDRRWTRAEVTSGGLVFLGDSYGSGEGAKDYDPTTDQTGENSWWDDLWGRTPPPKNMCHRSGNAAFHQVSGDWFGGSSSTFASCSGARTRDYWEETQGNDESAQRDALDENTSLVVVSMGGNDMQFADVLMSCAPVGGGSVDDCVGHWMDPQDPDDPTSSRWEQNLLRVFGTEPGGGNLGEVYADIRARTGDNAHVVVVGYPLVFDPDYDGIVFSGEEADWMNERGVELNARLREAAEHHGFTFVDPTEAFAGHGVGSDDPWILTFGFWGDHRARPPESYHPTARGQQAIADLIDEHLRSLP
ncbi:SGNH/GDSL hydrolase family protein [Ornithinimicrobium humiphilum]|uniref:GDSL-like lipase/acylhydrolase family protein n=1 Tax=Ornithinimicrobium humiphilum TaxID=125288 RepID=A0A543KQQ0_9MICO|nr:SGNH/GDSL hydrolase family protein [Ornithinimicrobium humiphilum]TQM97395.1 GDSL-like lipase/acylhydrolase family protein [Ornithinimicrobium humiphilum]